MSYFAPGFREIVRLARRASWRIRGWLRERQLARAETQLGLLGWQQADFDAETQRQVDSIQNVEREQAALTNRAAELAREIEADIAERARLKADFDSRRAALEAERAAAREPLAEIERTLRVIRERPAGVSRRTAELDREEREIDGLYKRLLGTQPQTPAVRDEILRLRERLIAIPNARADLKAQQARVSEDVDERERQRAAIEQRTAEFDRQLRDLKTQADRCDAEFAERLKRCQRERDLADASTQRLERAKRDPYREIGRVLADSGVAPVNQPQALAHVIELRERIEQGRARVAASLDCTAAEDPQMLRISLALWSVIALALSFILGALL